MRPLTPKTDDDAQGGAESLAYTTSKPSMEARELEIATGLNAEEQTEAEKKLLRKVDLYLLPAIWVVYLLSYMDRSNIGNARVAGMDDALGLDDNTYYYAVVTFQIGYVVAEIPSNMILAKSRPSLFIPALMFFWGSICAIIACVQTWQQLVGIRFILGIAEAGFSPAVMFIISSWYRRQEQSKRFMVFHSAGIAYGAFGSLIAGAITDGLDGALGIDGWRWLFIIEGVITVAVGFIIPFVILDYPLTSKKLTETERQLAYGRLAVDGISSRNDGDATQTQLGHLQALKIAVADWRVWILSLGYMTVIGCMSLAYFYPTLVEYMGYSSTDAQYMTAPLYGVALAIAIPLCVLADRFPDHRAFFPAAVLFCFGCVLCAVATAATAPVARYVLLCFINTAVWAGNPLSLSYTSSLLGPVAPEVRAICLAIINGLANLSQLYGTYVFSASEAPHFNLGFIVYSAIFAVGGVTYLSCHFLFRKWPYKETRAA